MGVDDDATAEGVLTKLTAVPGLLEVVERPGRCELVVTGTGEVPRARVELAADEADLLARLAGGR